MYLVAREAQFLPICQGLRNVMGKIFGIVEGDCLYNHPIKICRDGRHLIEQKFDLVKALLGEKESSGRKA